MSRVILVGDIHGALSELKLLLDKVSYEPGVDRCVALGDLVDRCDDSPGVVKYCIENGIESVMGNHDAKLVRRWRHVMRKRIEPGYKIPMHFSQDQMDTIAGLSDADMLWLSNLPHYLTFPEVNVVIMHAGLLPLVPLVEQPKEVLTMIRYIDPAGRRMLSMKMPNFEQPENSIFWAEAYDGTADVVFGHSVISMNGEIGVWAGLSTGKCYGIDTGCCFGGFLTCMILDTNDPSSREVVNVKALREYCVPSKK